MATALKSEIVNFNMAAIAAALAVVILYGSLYPFDFVFIPDNPFVVLLSNWRVLTNRGDVISNILLYAPLGFFGVQSWKGKSSYRLMQTVAAGTMLSVAIELMQFFDVGRYSALSDVYADAFGTFLGAVFGVYFQPEPSGAAVGRIRRQPFVVLLLACWLGFQLYPYVPVLNTHKYWDAIRPLFSAPLFPLLDLYYFASAWLAIALLFDAVLADAKSLLAVTILFTVVICGRILVVGTKLSQAEVAGGGIAILMWMMATALSSRARTLVVTVGFVGAVMLRGLEPFQINMARGAFQWIPFLSLMEGPIDSNVLSFFSKAFDYGSLIWLLVRAGCRWAMATMAGATLVLLLSMSQLYLKGRSPEITDVIILLLVSGSMLLMHKGNAAREN